jgi:biofilm PGA synthesis N-glycosyltransferase PgaC
MIKRLLLKTYSGVIKLRSYYFMIKRKMYASVKTKFIITSAIGLGWGAFSIWAAQPWFNDLSAVIGSFAAYFLILFIAIIPGCMNAFVFVALLLDKRPPVILDQKYPDITVLVAAYNEADSIKSTLDAITKQEYPASIQTIVINDGSVDATENIINSFKSGHKNIELINLDVNGGKAAALNQGLKNARAKIIISIDADSYLRPDAIKNIVGRYLSDPVNTKAVAGEVLIRNSRENWITKAQEWDYFLGIASIKRIQSLFQGTLVAQGAFSLYDKDTLVELGGWPEMVGEDIV